MMLGVVIAIFAVLWLLVMGLFWKCSDLQKRCDVAESRLDVLELLHKDELKKFCVNRGDYS